jgi:hypothetical protein
MKAWLRIPFALLAIVAMIATMLPQTLWACPMTGRIDTAARVCEGKMPVAGEMPCAKFGSKCCKPLTVPPSQDDDDPHHPHVYAATGQALELTLFVAPAVHSQPVILNNTSATLIQPVAVRTYLARFNNSPPSWWPQHRPPTLAGRAPPVL